MTRIQAGVIITVVALGIGAVTQVNFKTQVRGLPTVYAANSVASGGCGVTADNGVDQASLLTTCATAIQAAGGGTILLPVGVVTACDWVITAASGNRLRISGYGEGTESLFGSTGTGQSTLRFGSGCTSGSGHFVLKFNGTGTYPGLLGSGIDGVNIDAANLAENALITYNTSNARFTNMTLNRATGYAWVITGPGTPQRCGAAGGFNFIDNILITGATTGSTPSGRTSGGIFMELDPCSWSFGKVRMFVGDKAHGVWIKYADSNTFQDLTIYHHSTAGTIGISAISCSVSNCSLTTSEAHGLVSTYDGVWIQGSATAALQGAFVATVVDSTHFTIPVTTLSGSFSASFMYHSSMHLGNPATTPGSCTAEVFTTNCIWNHSFVNLDVVSGITSASYDTNIVQTLLYECCAGDGYKHASGFLVSRATGDDARGWTIGPIRMLSGPIILYYAPTSCSGQIAGTIWNNAGVANICP